MLLEYRKETSDFFWCLFPNMEKGEVNQMNAVWGCCHCLQAEGAQPGWERSVPAAQLAATALIAVVSDSSAVLVPKTREHSSGPFNSNLKSRILHTGHSRQSAPVWGYVAASIFNQNLIQWRTFSGHKYNSGQRVRHWNDSTDSWKSTFVINMQQNSNYRVMRYSKYSWTKSLEMRTLSQIAWSEVIWAAVHHPRNPSGRKTDGTFWPHDELNQSPVPLPAQQNCVKFVSKLRAEEGNCNGKSTKPTFISAKFCSSENWYKTEQV